MRRSFWASALILLAVAPAPKAALGQAPEPADRVRLAEGRRLAEHLCKEVWPGWGKTAFQLLLLGDSAEFLIGGPPEPEGFTRAGYDSTLGTEIWTRRPRFPPTLLATFPAAGGVPTIVVGSAERTGKSSTAWVLTLMHEHFHQWQYSQPEYYPGVARLGLTRGDTTGQWMLNYPFPYDSAPVQRATRGLAQALARALDAGPGARRAALEAVTASRDSLRGLLAPADDHYFEFQLWQEGTARFIEYAVARAAAKAPAPAAEFRRLPDYQPYGEAAESALRELRAKLDQLDLGQQRRVAFYPIGAAWALLLDRTRSDWKRVYTERPFALPDLP
jgi:hypothetical protein